MRARQAEPVQKWGLWMRTLNVQDTHFCIKSPPWSFPRIQTETTWDNSLSECDPKKIREHHWNDGEETTCLRNGKSIFQFNPSYRSISNRGPTLKEIHANVCISAPYFLEMPVAWCWDSSRGKDPTKKGRNAHSRNHGHTPRTQAWLFTEPLQCGTTRNENWGWRYLTSPKQLVYRRQDLDLIRQCGVLLGLSLQQSVHRMHPPLAFDAVQIHPPLLRVMN